MTIILDRLKFGGHRQFLLIVLIKTRKLFKFYVHNINILNNLYFSAKLFIDLRINNRGRY